MARTPDQDRSITVPESGARLPVRVSWSSADGGGDTEGWFIGFIVAHAPLGVVILDDGSFTTVTLGGLKFVRWSD